MLSLNVILKLSYSELVVFSILSHTKQLLELSLDFNPQFPLSQFK